MIGVEIKTDIPKRPRIRKPRFFALQMGQLAAAGLKSVKDRVQKGIGANDAPMPPLKRGYAIHKTKLGKGNRRNLTLTGAMLDNLTVRSATDREAKISLTKRLERLKALANQQKAPWLGWSPNDARNVTARAAQIFRVEVVPRVAQSLRALKRAA